MTMPRTSHFRVLLVLLVLLVAGPVIFGPGSGSSGAAGASMAAALPALAGALLAQQPRAGREGCDLVRSRRLNSIVDPSGQRVTYISGPLAFQCDDGTRIRADSVVDFQATRFRQLLGGVEIDGPETRLVADRVHRSDDVGRIEAWGSVEVEQKGSDTRMVGDSLVFFESGPSREESELTVRGDRPYAVLRLGGEVEEAGANGPPPAGPPPATAAPPDTVFADRLHLRGESRFVATGDVRVRRSEMDAFGDSLDFGRDENVAHLFGSGDDRARIEGEEFDLAARMVDLFLRGEEVEEIRAVERATLTGEDVEMKAPRIRIFMRDGETERLVAVRERSDVIGDTLAARPGAAAPGGDPDRQAIGDTGVAAVDRSAGERPEAVAEDFVLWADSIEVSAPGQRLDRVYAVGSARGESLARDSLNTPDMPDMIRHDWIEGDTIVAHFLPTDSLGRTGEAPEDPGAERDPAPPPEPGGADADGGGSQDGERPDYELDRLVAIGNARSLYRLAPQDSVSVVSVSEAPGNGGQPDGSPEDANADAGAAGLGGAPASDTVTVVGGPDSVAGDSTAAAGEPRRRRPAVHYVVGTRITIVLSDGQVERMEVQGQTRGLYLEPLASRATGGMP